MATTRRYKEIVPSSVQRLAEVNGVPAADWYIPSAANPGAYLDRLERMFPEPGVGAPNGGNGGTDYEDGLPLAPIDRPRT